MTPVDNQRIVTRVFVTWPKEYRGGAQEMDTLRRVRILCCIRAEAEVRVQSKAGVHRALEAMTLGA